MSLKETRHWWRVIAPLALQAENIQCRCRASKNKKIQTHTTHTSSKEKKTGATFRLADLFCLFSRNSLALVEFFDVLIYSVHIAATY